MSLALTANFVEIRNLVVPLAQNPSKNGLAIRVASSGSGKLGTLTASGNAAPVTWALNQNPSWVTLSVDTTTLVCSINFSNAQVQANAYQFFISATDGTTTQFFPIFLEVRDPFSIAATSGLTNFSIPSYDATVADIVFQGIGLNGAILPGVSFIEPVALPSGMKFITSDGGSMKLRVFESSANDISGGLALYSGSPISSQITLKAYKPGTIYDNPDRCYTQAFTIDSLTAKQGQIDLGLTVQYNTTLNAFELDSFVDFLNGEAQAFHYQWLVTGTATGNITSGGTSSSASMVWTPATAGRVGFTLNILNASTGAIIGQAVVNPTINSASGIPCAPSGSWQSTNGIKLSFSADSSRGWAGDAPTITISTLAGELGSSETVTVNLAVSTGSSIESTATLSQSSVQLTQSSPSATIQLTLPSSTFNQKWVVTATAENATSGATRFGFAEAVFLSNGGQPLTITNSTGSNNLTSNVGVSIPPITLTAKNNANAVVNATWSLNGAPAGLFINSSGQLTGNVLKPGTYTFELVAEATNYARSYSATITLVASLFSTPLAISDAIPSVASLPDNQQFNVSWGYTGTPTSLNMIQGFNVRSVLGTTEAATSEVGSSVITIYGTSFYGDAYSVPALVLSSSITANGDLPDSPTIGTIDENYNLTLQWNPLTVDGSYQAYKAWNIWLKLLPNGANQLQSVSGHLPTGLEPAGSTPDARLFETVLGAGDWQVSMQALTANTDLAQNAAGWDNAHEFPTAITDASITFDNKTLSLGQTLTITLDPNYIGADTWQAIYPDGTTSGWLPISVKSLAKVINIPGTQPIIIQTQRDYSKSNPPVKLMRQVTKTVFVMNQQYIGSSSNTELTGTLGFGGESGFEITDASKGAVALAPYEVVVRALVRDTVSNELKLMVATSRTPNASSLLGTMAIDVFPLQGRPRLADLIDPALYLSAEQAQNANPVRIATQALPNIVVGKPMADFPLQVVPNSGVGPFSWYADNLPFGIKLSINGTLSGTATQLGSFTSDFVVMDSNTPPFIAHATLTLTVESDLAIQTTTLPQAVVGTPYNHAIAQTGGLPPYQWSIVSGAPPKGLTLDPATGHLTGVAVTYNSTTDFQKTYAFTVQVVDAIGAIASAALTMTLAPAALQLGKLDQPEVFANDQFQLAIPIFGGKAPYKLSAFTDDGVIGTGLRIVNPDTIAAIAGVEPPTLTGTTPSQTFDPQVYPFDPAFVLTASGGTAPYHFEVVPGVHTTLPNAAVSGFMLTGLATADGSYSVQVKVTDAFGNTATQIISIAIQQQNASPYAIKPVSVNLNGSNNPANWTVTPISALPDAQNGQPYNGGSGTYYGLALYLNNVLHMTQSSGTTPMSFNVLSGALPNGIVAFSGNSFGQSTDYSGIVLFNVSGGENATVNGSYSFVAEFVDIVTAGGGMATCTSRESITVTTAGGGTTPVVQITTGAPIVLAADGAVDLHYTLTTTADSTNAPGPNAYVVDQSSLNSDQNAAASNARWISGDAVGTLNNGHYIYQTTFDLTGLDPTSAQLSGLIGVDDTVTVSLNGTQMFTASGFTTLTSFSITSGFVTGVNTLTFDVINNAGNPAYNNGGGSPNPTMLLVEITGTARSTTDLGLVGIPVYGTGTLATGQPGTFNVDLTSATGSPYPWVYPLDAEGGTAPYTFHIQSGSNMPGAAITTVNGLPALASASAGPGLYTVLLTATDANGVVSGAVEVAVLIVQSPTQPIHILDSNLPAYVYANRALPPNTYFVESDLAAAWAATGLPAGVSLSSGTGTRAYLQGTPTATGNFSATITATSISFNTKASTTAAFAVRAQTAAFVNPPTTAIVGNSYRTVNNNAILSVAYVGYQPGDSNLPLVTSQHGTVGAPGTLNNGTPTTAVSNLTADGFTLSYDYTCPVFGTDVLTLGNNLASINVSVQYPQLVVTGTTNSMTISEYSAQATFAPPVNVSGGLAPYTMTPSGTSDPRFTIQSGQIVVNVASLTPGQTTSCTVSVLVVDSSGSSGTATGVIQITVRQETFITVNYSNYTWNLNVSTGSPFTASIIPNQNQSIPVLGHAPYQYYVDSVTIPSGLTGFVNVSPSKRVLAVQCNSSSTSAQISDVDQSLADNGTFVVPAVAPGSAPAAGTYQIAATLRVVDSKGISSTHAVSINVVIS